jgi:hypothetical protein
MWQSTHANLGLELHSKVCLHILNMLSVYLSDWARVSEKDLQDFTLLFQDPSQQQWEDTQLLEKAAAGSIVVQQGKHISY